MFRVLIVDDHEYQVDSLIESIPWVRLNITETYKALSGYEALDMMREQTVDIVITDIRMPGMSGIDLIKKINEQWSATRCILLTGFAEFDYAREAIQYQAAHYLLKPVQEDELIDILGRLTESMRSEWEHILSYRQTLQTWRDNLPKLQDTLLLELLQGRRLPADKLNEALQSYNLPFQSNDFFVLALIRLDDTFYELGTEDLHLMQYAIGNIAKEIFSERFILWHGVDVYGFLVFLVKSRESGADPSSSLENVALRLQHSVKTFLKGRISILLGDRNRFPEELVPAYQTALSEIRQRVGRTDEAFIRVRPHTDHKPYQSLTGLYDFPTFTQLLESGRWETIQDKLNAIFNELTDDQRESQEYMLEIFLSISSSIMNISHKNGKSVHTLFGDDAASLFAEKPYSTMNQLKEWCFHVMNKAVSEMNKAQKYTSSYFVKRVQDYLLTHLSGDTSLQAVADWVHLHPVYLSRMYKTETGEGISDYLLRMKMLKAEYLLKNSHLKINEIAAELGYDNPQYFIKVFKNRYGTTPNDFRSQR